MNRLVFTIVMLLSLASCGMQKRSMSQDVQAEMLKVTIDSTDLQKKIESIAQAVVNEMFDKEISQDMTIERREWSAPDSTGKQHVIHEETVKTTIVARESKKSTTEIIEETSEQTDSLTVSISNEDSEIVSQTDVKESSGVPWWQKTLMIICVIVVILIVIRIVYFIS